MNMSCTGGLYYKCLCLNYHLQVLVMVFTCQRFNTVHMSVSVDPCIPVTLASFPTPLPIGVKGGHAMGSHIYSTVLYSSYSFPEHLHKATEVTLLQNSRALPPSTNTFLKMMIAVTQIMKEATIKLQQRKKQLKGKRSPHMLPLISQLSH